jgi:hypothetical protein
MLPFLIPQGIHAPKPYPYVQPICLIKKTNSLPNMLCPSERRFIFISLLLCLLFSLLVTGPSFHFIVKTYLVPCRFCTSISRAQFKRSEKPYLNVNQSTSVCRGKNNPSLNASSPSLIREAILRRVRNVCGNQWERTLEIFVARQRALNLSDLNHSNMPLSVSYRCWENSQRENTAEDEICGGA